MLPVWSQAEYLNIELNGKKYGLNVPTGTYDILLSKIKNLDRCPVCLEPYVGNQLCTSADFRLTRKLVITCNGSHALCAHCFDSCVKDNIYQCAQCRQPLDAANKITIGNFNNLVSQTNDIRKLECADCKEAVDIRDVLGNWHHCQKETLSHFYQRCMSTSCNRQNTVTHECREFVEQVQRLSEYDVGIDPIAILPLLNSITVRIKGFSNGQPVELLVTKISQNEASQVKASKHYRLACQSLVQKRDPTLIPSYPDFLYEGIIQCPLDEKYFHICILPYSPRLSETDSLLELTTQPERLWAVLGSVFRVLEVCHNRQCSFNELTEDDLGFDNSGNVSILSPRIVHYDNPQVRKTVTSPGQGLYLLNPCKIRALLNRQEVKCSPFILDNTGVLLSILRKAFNINPTLPSYLAALSSGNRRPDFQQLIAGMNEQAQCPFQETTILLLSQIFEHLFLSDIPPPFSICLPAAIPRIRGGTELPPASGVVDQLHFILGEGCFNPVTCQRQLKQMLDNHPYEPGRTLFQINCSQCQHKIFSRGVDKQLRKPARTGAYLDYFWYESSSDKKICGGCFNKKYQVPCRCHSPMIKSKVCAPTDCMVCAKECMGSAVFCCSQTTAHRLCSDCAGTLLSKCYRTSSATQITPLLITKSAKLHCEKCQSEVSSGQYRYKIGEHSYCYKCMKHKQQYSPWTILDRKTYRKTRPLAQESDQGASGAVEIHWHKAKGIEWDQSPSLPQVIIGTCL